MEGKKFYEEGIKYNLDQIKKLQLQINYSRLIIKAYKLALKEVEKRDG